MGRVVARYLGDSLKSTFFVENRVGAGGILGTRALAKAQPDGYTLCVCSGGAITVPSVTEKGYDLLVELVPVSRINTQPLVLVVKSTSPMKTVADVIEQGKTKTGGLSYGSSGAGGLLYKCRQGFPQQDAGATHPRAVPRRARGEGSAGRW